jgi:hypothetical protein
VLPMRSRSCAMLSGGGDVAGTEGTRVKREARERKAEFYLRR